jgi:hypothetical protein
MDPRRGLFSAVASFGLGQSALSLYDAVFEVPGISIGVDDRIADYNDGGPNAPEGTVLFPLIPGYSTLCYRFCVLAHAFRTRGYHPILLYDDDDLRASPELTVDDPHPTTTSEVCRFRARQIPSMFGLDAVSIDDALPAGYREPTLPDDIESATYRGVSISRIARTSVRKYLKRYTLDLSNPSVRRTYTDFLRDSIVLIDTVRTLIEDRGIDLLVVNEPYYLQGAVPLAVADRIGIDCYTQANGYLGATILFGRGRNPSPMPQFSDPSVIEHAVESPLDEAERDAVRKVMEGRKRGTIVRHQYSSGTGQRLDPDAETVVGVFTNLLWDASLIPDGAIYGDVYQWLSDTMNVLRGRSDIHVVIKAHPAEAKRGTNEGVSEWLDRTYESLPENVTHLRPDTDIDTYALMEDLDAGIVYNSTVGLEMAFEGLPVVTAGFPHYLGFDITYDPESKAEYRDCIDGIAELGMSAERHRRAERYIHFLFICKHFEFSALDTDPGGRTSNMVEHDDVAPGADPFDTIVERITEGAEVIRRPCIERLGK